MGVLWNDISSKSNGGTELLCRRLEEALDPALLNEVQIVPSRVYGDLDPTKVRVLYLHDLPHDPGSQKIFADQGWRRFHKIVCVSNWQMQHYIQTYNVPWSKFVVIPNSIEPITRAREWAKGSDLRFIYHTTPNRGLNILYAVFDKLSQEHDNVSLDVFSSFRAYGRDDKDKQFEPLFEKIKNHPKMAYHGFQSNERVRGCLAEADVFLYPNVWPETSCLALIEAMSAGLLCIHPNLGALSETAANWTMMYQYQEDLSHHAGVSHSVTKRFLVTGAERFRQQLHSQKSYADTFYNWNTRRVQWTELLTGLLQLPREFVGSFSERTAS